MGDVLSSDGMSWGERETKTKGASVLNKGWAPLQIFAHFGNKW